MSGRALSPSGLGDDMAKALGRFVERRRRFATQGPSPLVYGDSPTPSRGQLDSIEAHCQLLSINEAGSDDDHHQQDFKAVINNNLRCQSASSDAVFAADQSPDGGSASPLLRPATAVDAVMSSASSTNSSPVTPDTRLQRKIDHYRHFICSPSMFVEVKSPSSESSSFCWDVAQMAIMNPVDIDETDVREVESPVDSETERKMQQAIDEFFDRNLVVPSPEVLAKAGRRASPLSEPFDSPWQSLGVADKKRSVACQTVFTFARGFNFGLFFGPDMFCLDDSQLVGLTDSYGSAAAVRKRSHSSSGSSTSGLSEYEILSTLADGGECTLLKPGRKTICMPLRAKPYADSMMFVDDQPPLSIDSLPEDQSMHSGPSSDASARSRFRLNGSFKPRRINFDRVLPAEEDDQPAAAVAPRTKLLNINDEPVDSPLKPRDAVDNILKGRRQC